jgi:hypothetical protein
MARIRVGVLREMAVVVGTLLLINILAACGGENSSPLEEPQPRQCNDFVSGMEAMGHEATSAEEEHAMDPDRNGVLCDHPTAEFKDTQTHIEGLPSFEVAFVSDAPGIKEVNGGEIMVDVEASPKVLNPPLVEGIAWQAIKQVGPGTKTNFRFATINFRTIPSYNEVDVIAIYVADQEAADAVNRYWREERPGAEIEFFTGEVPEGGYLRAYRW